MKGSTVAFLAGGAVVLYLLLRNNTAVTTSGTVTQPYPNQPAGNAVNSAVNSILANVANALKQAGGSGSHLTSGGLTGGGNPSPSPTPSNPNATPSNTNSTGDGSQSVPTVSDYSDSQSYAQSYSGDELFGDSNFSFS